MNAITEFGFKSLNLTCEDFLHAGYVVQLGQPPNRIDLITEATGLKFDDRYPKRKEVDMAGCIIPFLDLESLKINKKATGRLQDLADIESLEQ